MRDTPSEQRSGGLLSGPRAVIGIVAFGLGMLGTALGVVGVLIGIMRGPGWLLPVCVALVIVGIGVAFTGMFLLYRSQVPSATHPRGHSVKK